MKILGVDPGYDRFGIAVVEGSISSPMFVMSDCIRPAKGHPSQRLAVIAEAIRKTIQQYAPEALAIESLFFNKSRGTALGVAEVRGVVLAAAGTVGIHTIECSPQEVKIAVTGYGRADKTAIARMLPLLLTMPTKKRLDDELDAIAVALTALARTGRSD